MVASAIADGTVESDNADKAIKSCNLPDSTSSLLSDVDDDD